MKQNVLHIHINMY